MKNLSYMLIIPFFVASCSTRVVDLSNPDEVSSMEHVMRLEYRDFASAASDMVNDMLASGAVAKADRSRYVMTISRITNDTLQRIDTDMLTKKIRTQLLNSGKVVVTNAVSLNEADEDPMIRQSRDLRHDGEVNQTNVAKKGTIVAPEISLSGKIIQRNLKLKWGKERVEYLIQMTITDLKTGLSIWEDERPIIKEGDDAPTW